MSRLGRWQGHGEHREVIVITDEAYRMVESFTRNGFTHAAGRRREDGMWEVPLSRDVIDRLNDYVWAGETLSDTIIRACNMLAGRRPQ